MRTASWPIAAVDVAGLASSLVGAVARLPFRSPWRGPSNGPRNLAVSTTRELTRSLLGYSASLPIDEFRALERVLDAVSGQALLPFVGSQGVKVDQDNLGGVPGLWFRPSPAKGETAPSTGNGGLSPWRGLYRHVTSHVRVVLGTPGASNRMCCLCG